MTRRLRLAGALSLLFIAALALVGWALGVPILRQVHPDWVPMQGNTAACFALLGVSLMPTRLPGMRDVAASLVLIVAALTACEYVYDVDIGIDEFLFTHEVTVHTSHPGRMAPNTALCFILIASGKMLPDRPRARNFCAVAAASLGIIAIMGYVFGEPRAHGWGAYTHMAAHTAAAFVLAAITSALPEEEAATLWLRDDVQE